MAKPVARVIRGHIVPSRPTVTKVLNSIKREIGTDQKLRRAWKKDPRQVLAQRGLTRDALCLS